MPRLETDALTADECERDGLCESCAINGERVLATNRSKHPRYSGYQLCSECAAEYDARS